MTRRSSLVKPRLAAIQAAGKTADLVYEDTLRRYSEVTGVDWQEIPVDMETFIRDENYSSFAQFLWPKIIEQLIEMANAYERGVSDITLEEPTGGGKSETCACFGAWLIHRLLCIKDPQAYFHIAPKEYLTVLNMAPSGKQANDVVFTKLANRIAHAKWFTTRGYLPDKNIKSELRFPKNIVCFPGNSSKTVALGYNIIYAILDEINFFEDKNGHDNADEIHDTIQSRISSRFSDFNEGLIACISSSNHELSFTRRKELEAQESPEQVMYRRRTIEDLWPARRLHDMKNVEHRGKIYSIPARLMRDYKRNPAKMLRNFYCVAGAGDAAYMPSKDWLASTCEGGKNLWDDDRAWPSDQLRPQEWGDVRRKRMALDGRPRYLHIDLAATRDACGIAMACLEGAQHQAGLETEAVVPESEPDPASGNLVPEVPSRELDADLRRTLAREARKHGLAAAMDPMRQSGAGSRSARPSEPYDYAEERPCVRLDFAARITASQHGGEVDFAQVRRIIYELRRRGFNIAKVTYDGWQSLDSIQELKRQGFVADTLSVDKDEIPYETLKECMLEQRLRWQEYEQLLVELSRLQRPKKDKIDHPAGGSKDVADAVAGAVFNAISCGGDWRVSWLQQGALQNRPLVSAI